MEIAIASPAVSRAFRRSRATITAMKSSSSATTGSTRTRVSSQANAFWPAPMLSALKIVKEAFTSGMRFANEKPSSIRICLTDSTNGAMLILTAPSETSTASLVSPVSTATICSWALRVAVTHACSNASEVTTWSTRARTKFSMALLSGTAREGSTSPARGGTKSLPGQGRSTPPW